MKKILWTRVMAAAFCSLTGASGATGDFLASGAADATERDEGEENSVAHEREDYALFLGTEYTRIGSERGARVALEASLFDALELGIAAGYDEERLRVGPGERRPDEREIELSAGWTFLEHDAGAAFGLVIESAWTRSDEGVFLEDGAEDSDDEQDDDGQGEGDPGSGVERSAELHLGLVAEIELGDRVGVAAELFRERFDGYGSAVFVTGREVGIYVLLTPGLTLGGSAARLRAAGEATEYSLGLAWAASDRILLGVEGSRRTAEPDLVTFGIELRLR